MSREGHMSVLDHTQPSGEYIGVSYNTRAGKGQQCSVCLGFAK